MTNPLLIPLTVSHIRLRCRHTSNIENEIGQMICHAQDVVISALASHSIRLSVECSHEGER